MAASCVALVFHARFPAKLPSENDYTQLADALGAQRQPGDAVVLFPWWTERARLFLPEGLPVYGYLGVENEDFLEHPRLWLLSQPLLPRADRDAWGKGFEPGRSAGGDERHFGPLRLQLYDNHRHRPLRFAATAALGSAQVYLERPSDGARGMCSFDGTRHHCPSSGRRGGPLTVAAEWHELRYVPRRCLWMPPPGGTTRLVAEFPDIPRSDGLLLEAGIIWEHAHRRDPALTPVNITVEAPDTGERVTELVLPPGLEGMQRQPFQLHSTQAGGPNPLRIAVQSMNPEARQVCVELRAFGAPSTSPEGASR